MKVNAWQGKSVESPNRKMVVQISLVVGGFVFRCDQGEIKVVITDEGAMLTALPPSVSLRSIRIC